MILIESIKNYTIPEECDSYHEDCNIKAGRAVSLHYFGQFENVGSNSDIYYNNQFYFLIIIQFHLFCEAEGEFNKALLDY